MKRKEFLSDEFKVIRTEQGQGNWAGYVKRFILELPDGTQFGAGVRGNQETMKTLYDAHHFLDYLATHPNATIIYHASDMILNDHSDPSYLLASCRRS